jgi:UDP-glucose 4-epimerase
MVFVAVLVAGLGYIGAALAEALLEGGEQVVALDNRFSTDDQAIARLVDAGVQFISGDIAVPADVETALRQAPIETVYLFAAQSSAHPRAADAVYTERTNLRGPRVVLDALLRHQCRTLVYASSFKVYGEQLHGSVDEQHPYGAFRDLSHLSKVYSEKLLEMYAGLHGLRCLALRYGIVHGLGPVCKTDPRFMTAPNKFCLQAARGEALSVYGGGRTPAGFVHVADAARAALAAADHAGFTGYTPLNVVGEVASVAQVAGWITAAGSARGLDVRITGLDPAGMVDEAARFTVRSGLDALPFHYAHTLRDSADAVLDHFAAIQRPVAGATR